MSYKAENVQHKAVQIGIIEQRSVLSSKKKNTNLPWLLISYRNRSSKASVWGEYKTEELARKQMNKMLRYFPTYVVEKSIFDKYYKGL